MDLIPVEPGLSPEEAALRLARDGPNTLPGSKRSAFGIVLEVMREPMFILLLAAAALYLTLGDLKEGLLLLLMVGATVSVTLYQEGKTERTLEALRDLSSPRALVIRNGKEVRIAGCDLVVGDILLLAEGDRVAADGLLISADNLQIDESLLTGESWPVAKRRARDAEEIKPPGGEDLPSIWSGTLVVQGKGVARVTATGARSEVGKIGSALQQLSTEASPLKKEVARLARVFALGGVVLSIAVAVIHGLSKGDWLQAILAGIALSMALLPEEFTVITTVFPAIGAWRLSKANVLTRRLAAIETLGSISVLCTDKTGTLTENRMAVTHAAPAGYPVQGIDSTASAGTSAILALADLASRASSPQAFDPMEKAFHALAHRLGGARDHADRPEREYPLTPELRVMSNVWRGGSGQFEVAAKGAPEAVVGICRMDDASRRQVMETVNAMARQGLRVLAVARASFSGSLLPASQEGFQFVFSGLLGLTDPLREEVPAAMRQCREAHIRVLMITGDHPLTAASIATQAGLPFAGVMTGTELEQLNDTQLRQRLRDVTVCARITPGQKLRIVQALKENGEVVAMTGDGVNDAPALKAAHVGIAMGGRGTDVAREASSMVLLDDNFASIVHGVRLGRRIYANMQNAMSYVLSIHVPIAGMAFLPAVFGWPILLFPMHIAFLELIIDPACSLAFENESSEADAMRRPPRHPKTSLFNRTTLAQSLLHGGSALFFVAASYMLAFRILVEGEARALGFTVLVMVNVALIFSNLSRKQNALHVFHAKNRIPVLVAGIAGVILLATIYIPALAAVFRFSPLSLPQLLTGLAIGITSLIWFDATKRLLDERAGAT